MESGCERAMTRRAFDPAESKGTRHHEPGNGQYEQDYGVRAPDKDQTREKPRKYPAEREQRGGDGEQRREGIGKAPIVAHTPRAGGQGRDGLSVLHGDLS